MCPRGHSKTREKKQVRLISALFGSKCLVTRCTSYASVWQGPPFWTAQIEGKAANLAVCYWSFVGASLRQRLCVRGLATWCWRRICLKLSGGLRCAASLWTPSPEAGLSPGPRFPKGASGSLGVSKTLLEGRQGQEHFYNHTKTSLAFCILVLS